MARVEWEAVVEYFQRSDFQTAVEKGRSFLNAQHKATPYQLLGVQVMLALASGERVALKSLASEESAELERLREKEKSIIDEATALRKVYQDADAVINTFTRNRTVGVQQGSLNHQKCLLAQAQMDDATKKIETLGREREAIKKKLDSQLIMADEGMKGDVIRLLGMLKESQETPAAFAICNVYLRKFGPDLDVAEFQQVFVRLQKIHDRAVKVVELIRSKQEPLVAKNRYWSAVDVAADILVRVNAESEEPELPDFVNKLMKADPLGIEKKRESAASERGAILELATIDGAKARGEFATFESRYPDFPDLAALRITILGEETLDQREIEESLVEEIETLVTVSPEKAMRIIESIDPISLSSPEKLRLKVRVTAAASQVIDKMLAALDSDLEFAMSLLGGQELVLQIELASKSVGNDRSVASRHLAELRSRIDKSRELPKALATLRAVARTSENLLALDLDGTQKIQLSGLKLKAELLLEATDG